ncbi:response regulator transcription factor [Metabacillus litoralis]|uniref:response regulator transcription factor n=1 Tax=Metabacillus litoralis TaxID=152268 RepID=UPI00203F4755|nr:response regulator transcription factor [Metabacillus litoralis]MCM3410009.1 response regulator transcription factor [Metabacillus litoralis]
MKIKVLLVDDHVLILDGLKQLLDNEEDIEVINYLSNPSTLFTVIQQTFPDIVVMDVRIKTENGIELTKKILDVYPQIKVVILSGYDYDEYIQAAFQAGASAFVTKERSNDELVSVIRKSYQGNKVFPRNMAKINQTSMDLTRKEREILKLVAEDKTNYEISDELNISKRTVERHISSIIHKLEAESRVGAVVIGIRKGLLSV